MTFFFCIFIWGNIKLNGIVTTRPAGIPRSGKTHKGLSESLHLNWWEQRCAGVLETSLLAGSIQPPVGRLNKGAQS